jgi:hypothetical protein
LLEGAGFDDAPLLHPQSASTAHHDMMAEFRSVDECCMDAPSAKAMAS